MRFSGHVFKTGIFWAIEVPILNIATQGTTKKNAYEMIADAIETLVNKSGFKLDVYPGRNGTFEIGSSDVATLSAFLLKRQRIKHGLTLAEVAKRMGAKSHNAYARYEQGHSVPSIEKFTQLLAALSADNDIVLMESRKL